MMMSLLTSTSLRSARPSTRRGKVAPGRSMAYVLLRVVRRVRVVRLRARIRKRRVRTLVRNWRIRGTKRARGRTPRCNHRPRYLSRRGVVAGRPRSRGAMLSPSNKADQAFGRRRCRARPETISTSLSPNPQHKPQEHSKGGQRAVVRWRGKRRRSGKSGAHV